MAVKLAHNLSRSWTTRTCRWLEYWVDTPFWLRYSKRENTLVEKQPDSSQFLQDFLQLAEDFEFSTEKIHGLNFSAVVAF